MQWTPNNVASSVMDAGTMEEVLQGAVLVERVVLPVDEDELELAKEYHEKLRKLRQSKMEATRLAEQQRLQAEQVAKSEAERLQAEKTIEAERVEAERIQAEKAVETERIEAERIEAERIEAEKTIEAERIEAERVEAERLQAEQARVEVDCILAELAAEVEAERLEAEQADRLLAEQASVAEAERLEAEQADRLLAEQASVAEAERLEAVKVAKVEADRLLAIATEERLAKERELADREDEKNCVKMFGKEDGLEKLRRRRVAEKNKKIISNVPKPTSKSEFLLQHALRGCPVLIPFFQDHLRVIDLGNINGDVDASLNVGEEKRVPVEDLSIEEEELPVENVDEELYDGEDGDWNPEEGDVDMEAVIIGDPGTDVDMNVVRKVKKRLNKNLGGPDRKKPKVSVIAREEGFEDVGVCGGAKAIIASWQGRHFLLVAAAQSGKTGYILTLALYCLSAGKTMLVVLMNLTPHKLQFDNRKDLLEEVMKKDLKEKYGIEIDDIFSLPTSSDNVGREVLDSLTSGRGSLISTLGHYSNLTNVIDHLSLVPTARMDLIVVVDEIDLLLSEGKKTTNDAKVIRRLLETLCYPIGFPHVHAFFGVTATSSTVMANDSRLNKYSVMFFPPPFHYAGLILSRFIFVDVDARNKPTGYSYPKKKKNVQIPSVVDPDADVDADTGDGDAGVAVDEGDAMDDGAVNDDGVVRQRSVFENAPDLQSLLLEWSRAPHQSGIDLYEDDSAVIISSDNKVGNIYAIKVSDNINANKEILAFGKTNNLAMIIQIGDGKSDDGGGLLFSPPPSIQDRTIVLTRRVGKSVMTFKSKLQKVRYNGDRMGEELPGFYHAFPKGAQVGDIFAWASTLGGGVEVFPNIFFATNTCLSRGNNIVATNFEECRKKKKVVWQITHLFALFGPTIDQAEFVQSLSRLFGVFCNNLKLHFYLREKDKIEGVKSIKLNHEFFSRQLLVLPFKFGPLTDEEKADRIDMKAVRLLADKHSNRSFIKGSTPAESKRKLCLVRSVAAEGGDAWPMSRYEEYKQKPPTHVDEERSESKSADGKGASESKSADGEDIVFKRIKERGGTLVKEEKQRLLKMFEKWGGCGKNGESGAESKVAKFVSDIEPCREYTHGELVDALAEAGLAGNICQFTNIRVGTSNGYGTIMEEMEVVKADKSVKVYRLYPELVDDWRKAFNYKEDDGKKGEDTEELTL